MKIRGDGRLGEISEVLGKRKWKEPRTWSSKWVTRGNGKVDKVKMVTEQRPRMKATDRDRRYDGEGTWAQDQIAQWLSGLCTCGGNELEAMGCEHKGIWKKKRIPSWFHGSDSALSLLRASVPSLVEELRFQKPHGVAKKQTKKNLWNDPWRMRVMGKREELTSQGGRASRQSEGPKPGPRSQQEHGAFWNSEPGIRGTSQTTTD